VGTTEELLDRKVENCRKWELMYLNAHRKYRRETDIN
jgi:hypothetical protein